MCKRGLVGLCTFVIGNRIADLENDELARKPFDNINSPPKDFPEVPSGEVTI